MRTRRRGNLRFRVVVQSGCADAESIIVLPMAAATRRGRDRATTGRQTGGRTCPTSVPSLFPGSAQGLFTRSPPLASWFSTGPLAWSIWPRAPSARCRRSSPGRSPIPAVRRGSAGSSGLALRPLISLAYGRLIAPRLAHSDPIVRAVATLGLALVILGFMDFFWGEYGRVLRLPTDSFGVRILDVRVTYTPSYRARPCACRDRSDNHLSRAHAHGAGDARARQPPRDQRPARRADSEGRFLGLGDVGRHRGHQRHPAREPRAHAAAVPDVRRDPSDRRGHRRPRPIARRGDGRRPRDRRHRGDRHALPGHRALSHPDALPVRHSRADLAAAPRPHLDRVQRRRAWRRRRAPEQRGGRRKA